MSMNSPDRPRNFYREHLEQGMLAAGASGRSGCPWHSIAHTRTEEKRWFRGGGQRKRQRWEKGIALWETAERWGKGFAVVGGEVEG